MSDEPLYCRRCGEESCSCMPLDGEEDLYGPHCDVCGVIPQPELECNFMRKGGRREGCVPFPGDCPCLEPKETT